jgi:phosphoribosyl 1,2-cyclic phosphodiesterase
MDLLAVPRLVIRAVLMIIRCYGARGSIPVSGREYLKYGGDTTCMEIRTKNDEIIVIDAGSGIRRLGNKLVREGRCKLTLLFTHSHWDHILGFPFFKPIYDARASIRLMGCPISQGNLRDLLSKAMLPPYFPVPFGQLNAEIKHTGTCHSSFQIDSVEVSSINISHPNQGLGYKFTEDGKSFVFLTDNELGFKHPGGHEAEEYVAFAAGADLLIHDAEYTREQYLSTRSWGHSTFADALDLGLRAGVKSLGLFHHNQDRTDEEEDAIVAKCREIVAENNSKMECFALTQTTEIIL